MPDIEALKKTYEALQEQLVGKDPSRAKLLRKQVADLEAQLRAHERNGSYDLAAALYRRLLPLRSELAELSPQIVDSRDVVAAELALLEARIGTDAEAYGDAERLDYLRHDCPAGPALPREEDDDE